MDARREGELTPMKNRTTVERKPGLLKRWWGAKSTGVSLLSCEADVRVGGRYRFELGHEASKAMAFCGWPSGVTKVGTFRGNM